MNDISEVLRHVPDPPVKDLDMANIARRRTVRRHRRRVTWGVTAVVVVATGWAAWSAQDGGVSVKTTPASPADVSQDPAGTSTSTTLVPTTGVPAGGPIAELEGVAEASYRDPGRIGEFVAHDVGGVEVLVPAHFVVHDPLPVAQRRTPQGWTGSVNASIEADQGSMNVTVARWVTADAAARQVAGFLRPDLQTSSTLLDVSRLGTDTLVIDHRPDETSGWHGTIANTGQYVLQVNGVGVDVGLLHDIALATVSE